MTTISRFNETDMETKTLQQLFDDVRQWGIDKGITGPSGRGTIHGQAKKMMEEATETAMAASSLVMAQADVYRIHESAAIDELIDGIGDTMVTLILLAELAGIRAEDCLESAYGVIAKRKGSMINGQFVKE